MNYKISVAIPAYEMRDRGVEMLNRSFFILSLQTLSCFEIVVSDDSENDEIKNVCRYWNNYHNKKNRLSIKYFKNEGKKGCSSNLNNAISKCEGKLIKILCQDDFLYDKWSLQETVDSFDCTKGWLVSPYFHTVDGLILNNPQYPAWNDMIYLDNTIGTHSSLTIINKNPLLFDENLCWYLDCEMYYRLYLKYGLPKILNRITFVQYLWPGQTTNTLVTKDMIIKEKTYLVDKYFKKT